MSEHHDDRPPLEAGKPAAHSDRADISKGDFSHGVHMETYVKLFGSIIHSTVWQADLHVKVVWITLLAMADEDGNVWSSIPGLAKAAGVSIEQCTEALRCFMAPDAYSRTKDHDGRRVAEIDGGWLVLNYTMYRRLASSQDKKNAEKQRRYRDRNASRYVTLRNVTTEGEGEVEGEVKEEKRCFTPPSAQEVTSYGKEIGFEIDGQEFVDFYSSKGWQIGTTPMKDWKAAVRTWKRRRVAEHEKSEHGRKPQDAAGVQQKTKLFPLTGKLCSKPHCGQPAVYKCSGGQYDHYACAEHMPAKIKEKFQ